MMMKSGYSGPSDARTAVLVADDNVLVREGLKMLVRSIVSEIRFVEPPDGDALVEALRENAMARLALVDVRIPAMQGGYRLLELARHYPHIPLVVVSAPPSPHLVHRLINVHSVHAVLPRSATTDQVRAAIVAAMHGRKLPLPPRNPNDIAQRATLLTPRQREICALLRQGMSNKIIAMTLGIGEGTVKNHITDIFRVLNATNRTQAAQLHVEVE